MRAPRHKKVEAAPVYNASSPCAARNTVACSAAKASRGSGLQDCSGISDSKNRDAAALAVELASNSSWSEAFSPSATSAQGIMNEDLNTSQESHQSHYHTSSGDTDLGPPPEYSPSSEHDLLPDSSHSDSGAMQYLVPRQQTPASTQLAYGDAESVNQQDPSVPLLSEASDKPPDSSCPWTRTNSTADPSKYRLRWLHTVMGFVVSIIAGGLLVRYIINPLSASSQQSLPLVPTERVHVQHETYEDIRGRFELYDKLELSTTTGAIDIQIDLQPGNCTAKLILSSNTGAIKLGISDSWWSRGTERSLRPVHTEIITITGSIYGRILLGQGGYASVDSVTGEQDLRVYVYDATPDDPVSELITRSHVGDQVVALTHFGASDITISSLKATHHSLGTASLDLQYSHTWRGEVHAVSSASSKIEVQGDVGLVFDKNEAHEVLAHKGRDSRRQRVEILSYATGSAFFKSWYTW